MTLYNRIVNTVNITLYIMYILQAYKYYNSMVIIESPRIHNYNF